MFTPNVVSNLGVLTVASLTALTGLLIGFQGGRQYQRAHVAWGTYKHTLHSIPRLYRNAWCQAKTASMWVGACGVFAAAGIWFAIKS